MQAYVITSYDQPWDLSPVKVLLGPEVDEDTLWAIRDEVHKQYKDEGSEKATDRLAERLVEEFGFTPVEYQYI